MGKHEHQAAFATDATARPLDMDAGRRAFLRSIGLSAAGAAILAGGATLSLEAQAQGGPTDEQILNFALNLEYLEAEFYLHAAFGRELALGDTTGAGPRGSVVGGRQVNFDTDNFRQYAEEIALDEEAHVRAIRATLGALSATVVARPRINIRQAFTAAAQAAGLVAAGDTFDPYVSETNFLLAAFIFEDVGVTAYKGAARFISNKDVLEAAAGILAVEAYHAGAIRTILIGLGLFRQANAISRARDSLDGASDLDQGVRLRSGANIVPTDANGIAFSRSPQQVLNIVYLDPNGNPGGFFPNGLNGAIA